MSKTLTEKLEALAVGKEQRSQTARLREIYPQIEKSLKSGVNRQAVLDVLNSEGFTLSMSTFEKTLYRIRKGLSTTKAPLQETKTGHDLPKNSIEKKAPHPAQTDFRRIRNQELDLVSLSEKVKS